MLFRKIVQNFSNNVYDDTVYYELVSNYADSLSCKGVCCDHFVETKKTVVFFIKESFKKKKIEKINKEFWMSIFHDIKNPMVGIDFALKKADNTRASAEILKDVYNLNQSNLEFIRAILENYRFEEGFFEKKHEKINLREILEELIEDHKYILQEKGIRININEVGKKLTLTSCPISISRVFINLISNAIKFANKGSEITIKGKILDGRKDRIFISIANYGKKIEDPEDIFKKFTSHTGSSGLGLHICRKIIDDMGGEIWAENFDVGARFCILLER